MEWRGWPPFVSGGAGASRRERVRLGRKRGSIMSRMLVQGRSKLVFAIILGVVAALGASPATAGHDHKKTTKYDLVQGYILQPQANSSASPTPLQATSASSQSTSLTSSPSPEPRLQLQLTPQPQLAPTTAVTLQLVPAPVQTVQLSLVPAPTQALQLAPAPMQTVQLVHYVQVQTVQIPTFSIAPQVQTAGPNSMMATPIQLLIPRKSCHLFGH